MYRSPSGSWSYDDEAAVLPLDVVVPDDELAEPPELPPESPEEEAPDVADEALFSGDRESVR